MADDLDTPMDTETVDSTVSPGLRGSCDTQGNALAFTITDDQRLTRFLILGSEGGSFYAKESLMTAENAQCIIRLIEDGQGERVVEKVVEMVREGRCIRMKAPLLALALCCRSQDVRTKTAAFQAVVEACSIPTHLFGFIQSMKSCHPDKKSAGWGRSLRKVVTLWYNKFAANPRRLAVLVTKYRQREGWSHHDVIRLGHVKPDSNVIGFILRYLAKGLKEAKEYYLQDGISVLQESLLPPIIQYLEAVEEARLLRAPKRQDMEEVHQGDDNGDAVVQRMVTEVEVVHQGDDNGDAVVQRMVTLIQQFRLLREHVPSAFLRFQVVWQALVVEMPLMALIRNLNHITTTGVLQDPDNLKKVLEKLGNTEALKAAKVHPYAILTAWYTYRSGHGLKGRQWMPNLEVCQALEEAFYASFGNVPDTGKRLLIAVDISASMGWSPVVSNNGAKSITPRVASTAMCLVTLQAESCVDIVAFSTSLIPLGLEKGCRLDGAIRKVESFTHGGTDCSQPMLWAKKNGKKYDAFIIYTDSETWHSGTTPAEALREYRRHSGITNARLAVMGMTSAGFSLADPQDLYMMDVVGFDIETPAILHEFISGALSE